METPSSAEDTVSELEFQKVFARLLTDGDMRAELASADGLAAGGVTGEAALRLRQLDRERVDVYAELLILNRLSKAMEGLPYTTKVLKEHLGPIAVAWNQASPPVRSKKFDEAMAFAQYLLETIGSRPYEPPYLKDLLLHEMSGLELRCTYNGRYPDELTKETPALLQQLGAEEGLSSIYPCRMPHVRLLASDHDVEAIIQDLDHERAPAAVPLPSPRYLLMYIEPGGVMQQFEVNLPTAGFLSEASGQASFASILSTLAQAFGQEEPATFKEFRRGCVDLCGLLAERRVIGLSTSRLAEHSNAGLLN
jgi:hypothetical protein